MIPSPLLTKKYYILCGIIYMVLAGAFYAGTLSLQDLLILSGENTLSCCVLLISMQ